MSVWPLSWLLSSSSLLCRFSRLIWKDVQRNMGEHSRALPMLLKRRILRFDRPTRWALTCACLLMLVSGMLLRQAHRAPAVDAIPSHVVARTEADFIKLFFSPYPFPNPLRSHCAVEMQWTPGVSRPPLPPLPLATPTMSSCLHRAQGRRADVQSAAGKEEGGRRPFHTHAPRRTPTVPVRSVPAFVSFSDASHRDNARYSARCPER